jgi:hypothetical protein
MNSTILHKLRISDTSIFTFISCFVKRVFGFVNPPFSICVHTENTDDFRAKMSTFILMASETCLYLPIIVAVLLLYTFLYPYFYLPFIYYATFETFTAALMNIQSLLACYTVLTGK